jgi:CubicO group peptidase (beta-lactamase class C family)
MSAHAPLLRSFAAALLLAAGLAVPAAADTGTPSDAALLQMLHARVDLQKGATGIVVGIARPGGHHILAYGTRGLDDRRPVDGRTVFDVGSITKVLTALLLSDMAQRHEVTLDDPVSNYFLGATLPTREGKEITLVDLATHTSGLPLRPTNLPSKDPVNPYAGYTREELFDFLSTYKLTHTPGTTYEYSNVGFGLLGIALSERAHKSFVDLVSERITAPLGMNDTRIVPTSDMLARAATGYDKDLHPVPHEDAGVLASAGSYRSTTDDLLKLADAFLGFRNTSLAPAVAAMTQTRRPGGMEPATAIALAWNIWDEDGREIVWKNGSVNGFRAFIGFDRAARLGVVALANAQTGRGADDIGLHILNPAFPVDSEIPRHHTEIALAPSVLDQFVGRFEYSPTDIINVTRNGNHLYVVAAGTPPLEMYAWDPSHFFLKVDNIEVAFDAMKDGHATKAIWHQNGHDQTGERIK